VTVPVAKVPLFDLVRVLEPHRPALHAALQRCLEHGQFVLGPEVAAFEQQLGRYTAAPNVIGVSSGTDALLATFLALLSQGRLQPGDEILVTSFTFIATATSVLRAGLRPVFVDLAPNCFHPEIEQYQAAWGPRTRGILVVHLFGAPQPLADLRNLCGVHDALLIEDCAQAIGAHQPDGLHVGMHGDVGTLSFFPAKNLGALGDGGAVLTADAALGQRVREIRQHGCAVRYQHDHLGGNFRLDSLHAAFLGVLLPHLDGWIAQRRKHAQMYTDVLSPLAAAHPERLILPAMTPGHAWNQFVVRTPQRDRLRAALDAAGIGSAVYYPTPLHKMAALAGARPAASLPQAERACAEVLALPVYPGLTEYEHARVTEVVATSLSW
jgi:dTDP-4-amino-4,6-dideoxygalactose transaminase